mmetsp:Transcript_40080/g.98505  ORF Transcript_40080/g.98505 Transcript_40080/m.98505 type:complete len:335 (+) Transcript_40080:92-1096(+)
MERASLVACAGFVLLVCVWVFPLIPSTSPTPAENSVSRSTQLLVPMKTSDHVSCLHGESVSHHPGPGSQGAFVMVGKEEEVVSGDFVFQTLKNGILTAGPNWRTAKIPRFKSLQTEDTFFVGYCKPYLHCPWNAPVAFSEIPKNGCTSTKKWLKQMDNMTWDGHTEGNICCIKGTGRIRFLVTRDPFARLLSGFKDKVLLRNGRAPIESFARTFKGAQTWETFDLFVQRISQIPDSEIDDHFRSQHLHDPWYHEKTSPLIMRLQLEEIATGWTKLQEKLCKFFSYCNPIVPLGRANASRKPPSRVLWRNVSHIVVERYRQDFQAYGYNLTVGHE